MLQGLGGDSKWTILSVPFCRPWKLFLWNMSIHQWSHWLSFPTFHSITGQLPSSDLCKCEYKISSKKQWIKVLLIFWWEVVCVHILRHASPRPPSWEEAFEKLLTFSFKIMCQWNKIIIVGVVDYNKWRIYNPLAYVLSVTQGWLNSVSTTTPELRNFTKYVQYFLFTLKFRAVPLVGWFFWGPLL